MGIKTKQQQQHHPNPLPHSQSRRGGSSAEPGRRSSLKVPPCRCEGCAQLSHSLSPSHSQSLWVRRRRTSAAPLSIITLCAALRCSARSISNDKVQRSLADPRPLRLPYLSLSLSLSLCVCAQRLRDNASFRYNLLIYHKRISPSLLSSSRCCVCFSA